MALVRMLLNMFQTFRNEIKLISLHSNPSPGSESAFALNHFAIYPVANRLNPTVK